MSIFQRARTAFLGWLRPEKREPSWIRYDRSGLTYVETSDPNWQAMVLKGCREMRAAVNKESTP